MTSILVEKRHLLTKKGRTNSISISPLGDNNNNNNETGSRSSCMRLRSDPPNFGPMERCEKQTNNID